MGRIQTNIGLITGFPIVDTVDQLISISAQPRDLLRSRTQQLSAEQVAITQLTSFLVTFQDATNNLGKNSLFESQSISSSNEALLTATANGNAVNGSYLFTPIRRATAQQVLSNSIIDKSQAIGAGSLTFQAGGFVDRGVKLSRLNDGQGVRRGQIRITDRSGTNAVVDLTQARTVDDVLAAINTAGDVNVTAEAHGDRIRLIDKTQQSVANLRVQEVNRGSTAADLGLAGIDTNQSQQDGDEVLRLYDGLWLSQLNGGNGVTLNNGVEDLRITFRDGSTDLDIDITTETTLEDLLATFNSDGRIAAQVSADGDHLELTDQTAGANSFSVSSLFGGTLAEDLGIAQNDTDADGIITSDRLQPGLNGALLRNLKGGFGTGPLGLIDLTDRNGSTAFGIDLSTAETLQDVTNTINNAAVGITARVNDARNGILLEDTSGGTGNLIVANGDATDSADTLGISMDAAENTVNGGSLDLQTVHEKTLLSSLNGGRGVDLGSLIITSSKPNEMASIKLNDAGVKITTVGGVIDEINAKNIGVQARINDTGDGIVLIDTAGGSGALTVFEVNGTTAADLGILGTATEQTMGGNTVDAIDGSQRVTIQIDAADTLDDLIDKINKTSSGVTASSVFDGQGYRLSIVSDSTGRAGERLIDVSGTTLSLQKISQAQDALLAYGPPDTVASSILISSSNNTFTNVVEGTTVTLNGIANEAVTIEVAPSESSIISAAQAFVDAYNAIVDNIDSATFFDEIDNSTGILLGSSEVLRVESGLTNLLTGSFFGLGKFRSLEEVGIGLDQSGKLVLDSTKLTEAFEHYPEALETFFAKQSEQGNTTLGVFAKLDELIESLAGDTNSLLSTRSETLSNKIDNNNERIDLLNQRLDTERQLLLNQFFQMETIIAQLQNSISALNSLSVLAPLTTA